MEKKGHGLRAVKLTEVPLARRLKAAQGVPASERDVDVIAAALNPSDKTYWVPAQAVEVELVAA